MFCSAEQFFILMLTITVLLIAMGVAIALLCTPYVLGIAIPVYLLILVGTGLTITKVCLGWVGFIVKYFYYIYFFVHFSSRLSVFSHIVIRLERLSDIVVYFSAVDSGTDWLVLL
jgi:hypothetical protein